MVRWIAIAIIVIAVVASGTIIYLDRNNGGGGGQQVSGSADISKLNTTTDPFVGDAKAPAIAFWSDYQCPFCKQVDEGAMAQIYDEYVKTGKLKIVYKDFVFLGDDSVTAALATRAVWEVAPDKFYQWHEAMFGKQDGENSGWGNKNDILALTQSLGIDSVKVGGLMDQKKDEYQKAIDADKAEGGTQGIKATPSFVVGKQFIEGAQPYATIKAAIDTALAGK